jgi:uncharacterized membrane protein
MADVKRVDSRLDTPREIKVGWRVSRPEAFREGAFGVWSERFARFMGTPKFLLWMTIFVVVWLIWNTFGPKAAQFDPRDLNYTLLTLILSLQASYAAPLLLLAQNRQDDRDRVTLEQDRSRDERNLADTEYLTREVAALRISMRDMATRDFLRSELRELLDEWEERAAEQAAATAEQAAVRRTKRKKKKTKARVKRPSSPSQTPEPTGGGKSAT